MLRSSAALIHDKQICQFLGTLKFHLLCSISFHIYLYYEHDYLYDPNNPMDPPTNSPTEHSGRDPLTVSPAKSTFQVLSKYSTRIPTEQTKDYPTDMETHDDIRCSLKLLKKHLGRYSYGKCEGKPCRNQLPHSMEYNVSL